MADMVSVSEDKLYRALSELKLDIIKEIREATMTKAEQADVVDLRNRVASLETSRTSRAHIESDVKDSLGRINVLEDESNARKISLKTLKVAVVGGLLGAVGFVGELVVAIYYIKKL